MLDELTSEMKEGAAEYRVENHTISEVRDWITVNFPGARVYELRSFENWCASQEGRILYRQGLCKWVLPLSLLNNLMGIHT